MKRGLTSSVIILSILTSIGYTQTKFGVKGGLNFSSLAYSSDVEGNKSKLGFGIGGFGMMEYNESIDFRLELLFLQKGDKFENGSEVTQAIDYLSLPAFVTYALSQSNETKFTPFIQAGPEVALNLSAKAKNGGTDDFKEDVNSVDFLINIGIGAKMDVEGDILIADVRYSLGLTNIAKELEDETIKNRGIQLMIGYVF